MTAVGSCKKALWIFTQRGGAEALRQAIEARRNDLLVYVAFANLRRRVVKSDVFGVFDSDEMATRPAAM